MLNDALKYKLALNGGALKVNFTAIKCNNGTGLFILSYVYL